MKSSIRRRRLIRRISLIVAALFLSALIVNVAALTLSCRVSGADVALPEDVVGTSLYRDGLGCALGFLFADGSEAVGRAAPFDATLPLIAFVGVAGLTAALLTRSIRVSSKEVGTDEPQ